MAAHNSDTKSSILGPPEGLRTSPPLPEPSAGGQGTPRTWSPLCRIIDARDAARRARRKRRHGAARARLEPMAAGVRLERETFRPDRAGLPEGWAEFIDSCGPWDWFSTHTFTRDISPDPAMQRFDQWLGRLRASLDSAAPLLKCVVAIEWTCFGRVHLHAVLKAPGLDDARRARWRHRWEGLDGACGMARIHPAVGRASGYLAKYCGKGGIIIARGCFRGRTRPGLAGVHTDPTGRKPVRSTAAPGAHRPASTSP